MTDAQPRQRRASPETDAATRTALLDATRDCVRDHGIAGATSRRIAAAAGANLGAITYYFGSKDALVADALFGEISRRLDPVFSVLESDLDAPTRLMSGVAVVTTEFARVRDDVPVFLHALMSSIDDGPLADRGRALVVTLRQRLTHVVGQLVDDGFVAPWVQPDAMASLLVAVANGVALSSRLDPDGPSVGDIVGQLAGLLLAARPAA